jgi:molybdate transport system substrate-binding protein
MQGLTRFMLVLALLASTPPAAADPVLVAVAANFVEPLEQIAAAFEAETGHRVTPVSGSSGKLYAQIVNGAPYHLLLAADQARPQRLEAEGHAVSGTRFTYALGRLTLWSPDPQRVAADGAATLRAAQFRRLAMANPALAPYGAAARQTLEALGLAETLAPRIVLGENVAQAHAMVATGNAELGFVALSYVLSPRNPTPGSRWDVPIELYQPIRQDAVLLLRARDNPAAQAFLAFLASPAVRERLGGLGYGVE